MDSTPFESLDAKGRSLWDQHVQLILTAARAGLSQHPLVVEPIKNWQALGQWRVLRRARSGLEKGIQKLISPRELELWARIDTLRNEERPGGQIRPWDQIRRVLISDKSIRKMTRQAFHKMLGRLGFRDRPIVKVEKHPPRPVFPREGPITGRGKPRRS